MNDMINEGDGTYKVNLMELSVLWCQDQKSKVADSEEIDKYITMIKNKEFIDSPEIKDLDVGRINELGLTPVILGSGFNQVVAACRLGLKFIYVVMEKGKYDLVSEIHPMLFKEPLPVATPFFEFYRAKMVNRNI